MKRPLVRIIPRWMSMLFLLASAVIAFELCHLLYFSWSLPLQRLWRIRENFETGFFKQKKIKWKKNLLNILIVGLIQWLISF
jgi:hypothetical protein